MVQNTLEKQKAYKKVQLWAKSIHWVNKSGFTLVTLRMQ